MAVHTEADRLENKALILSGFSFTALTFMVGFYHGLPSAAFLVTWLLFSSILFLLTAEVAGASIKIWELVVAESMYSVSVFALFGSFIFFVWEQLGTVSYPILAILLVAIGFYMMLTLITARAMWMLYNRKDPA